MLSALKQETPFVADFAMATHQILGSLQFRQVLVVLGPTGHLFIQIFPGLSATTLLEQGNPFRI